MSNEPLTLERVEGKNLNYFLQTGPVSAHLLLTSGENPRLLVAFPAGNSGVVVWFKKADSKVEWVLKGVPQPLISQDSKGRPLYGIAFKASTKSPALTVAEALLSNVRVIRDAQATGYTPEVLKVAPTEFEEGLVWEKDRLDGAPGYQLSIRNINGELTKGTFSSGKDGWIDFEVIALSGEKPLTPITQDELLNGTQLDDEALVRTLRFLSYREKFLAGSWRFNTYFGRDTLISLRLLMPALTSGAVQNGLASILERLSAEGEVAHEEDIAEFAVFEHDRDHHKMSDEPLYSYSPIDGAFLLPPIATDWLLSPSTPRSQATAFLERIGIGTDGASRPYGESFLTNLRFALKRLIPFAEDPVASNLIRLRPGTDAGNWRDSGDGIGNGQYPYDVNAVLAPATLEAIARLHESKVLRSFYQTGDEELFVNARAMAKTWREVAPTLFSVSLSGEDAVSQIAEFAKEIGVPADEALASLPQDALTFHAVSLDEDGQPIPILHSDEAFTLLFGTPDPKTLEIAVASIMRPFPAGLITDAGMLVANPAFASPTLKGKFSHNAYHGTVIWSWQQAMMAAGLERQLLRTELPTATRDQLLEAQATLWRVIEAGQAYRNSELWSWNWADGKFHVAAFGADSKDVDESNAAQLWSTVYLAVKKPELTVRSS